MHKFLPKFKIVNILLWFMFFNCNSNDSNNGQLYNSKTKENRTLSQHSKILDICMIERKIYVDEKEIEYNEMGKNLSNFFSIAKGKVNHYHVVLYYDENADYEKYLNILNQIEKSHKNLLDKISSQKFKTPYESLNQSSKEKFGNILTISELNSKEYEISKNSLKRIPKCLRQ